MTSLDDSFFKIRNLTDEQRAKPFRVTEKELARASEDGTVIVARPQEGGTKGLFALDVSNLKSVRVCGTNWYEIPEDGDVTKALTMLNRDLNKFFGRGGDMSSSGRSRALHKELSRKDKGHA